MEKIETLLPGCSEQLQIRILWAGYNRSICFPEFDSAVVIAFSVTVFLGEKEGSFYLEGQVQAQSELAGMGFAMGYSHEASPQDDEVASCGASNYNSAQYESSPANTCPVSMPSAPPLTNSSREVDQGPKIYRADANHSATETESNSCRSTILGATEVNTADVSSRTASVFSHPLSARYPTYHLSKQDRWYAYEACVRLCLHSADVEAHAFLENECAMLRDAFRLTHLLLQSGEELSRQDSPNQIRLGSSMNVKILGEIKIQVCKVKMGLKRFTGCLFSPLNSSMVKSEPVHRKPSNVKSTTSSEKRSFRKGHVASAVPDNGSSLHKHLRYMIVGTQWFAGEAARRIKRRVHAWHSNSLLLEVARESYSASLRLKSSSEVDAVKLQPGSGETHTFLLDRLGDELVIEVHDSNEKYCGRATIKVADISDEQGEKVRSFVIYHEPEHTEVGEIQLRIIYSTMQDENSEKSASAVVNTAYDCVLATAMKVQHFNQRNLLLHGSWRWLVTEFASHYRVSDAYSKLRYLSYVLKVWTPTAECLNLVHDLLVPLVMKGDAKQTLSYLEVRAMGEVSQKVEQILSFVFENYKSLDDSSSSGITNKLGPATEVAVCTLAPALKLYNILHDILSPEIQSKLRKLFQHAVKMRSSRLLAETYPNTNQTVSLDSVDLSRAYEKMVSLCLDFRMEIFTDIEIHKQGILPSFIDLPNLSSEIYSTELYSRLRAFLGSFPPSEPTPHVVRLVIAAADFQRDLSLWNISYTDGGVDARELFRPYITQWIKDKRCALIALCKLKVNFSRDSNYATFVDDIYNQLNQTLAEYASIISRWPEEYTYMLENAMADVEMAVVESLEQQYAKVLAPLRKSRVVARSGLEFIQKLARGKVCPYSVPKELGIVLNSMNQILNFLQPTIESQIRSWGSCMPENGNTFPGESLAEVAAVIKFKFRAYIQAVVDKLVMNTKLHSATKLKKIIKDAKENAGESDLRRRVKELFSSAIDQLHWDSVLENEVFILICQGVWDHMGEDVLKFLEKRKRLRSWCKASRLVVTVLNDTFASRLQDLLGNALQEKDLEPPASIQKLQLMLSIDASK